MSEFQSEQQDQEQHNTLENSITMKNGGNFYFDVQVKQVRAWFSAFTGKEKVYVNDVLVSSKWSLGRVSSHSFTIDDVRYTLKIGLRSWLDMFQGAFIAELYRGEVLIDQDEICIGDDKKNCKPFSWKQFALLFIAGLMVGWLIGSLLTKIFGA